MYPSAVRVAGTDGSVSSHGRVRLPPPGHPRRHRDGDDQGGGGEALPVAEPQVQGHVREQQQLRQRVQDGELPRRRVQVARPRAQVLLQEGLLVHASPAVSAVALLVGCVSAEIVVACSPLSVVHDELLFLAYRLVELLSIILA
uniref:Uncharacterized protein n=1 Tax=Oryza rufipogon TaxID=4529 RepID=A0A0E0NI32_ORYRU